MGYIWLLFSRVLAGLQNSHFRGPRGGVQTGPSNIPFWAGLPRFGTGLPRLETGLPCSGAGLRGFEAVWEAKKYPIWARGG